MTKILKTIRPVCDVCHQPIDRFQPHTHSRLALIRTEFTQRRREWRDRHKKRSPGSESMISRMRALLGGDAETPDDERQTAV
jgi:hypothetical protein